MAFAATKKPLTQILFANAWHPWLNNSMGALDTDNLQDQVVSSAVRAGNRILVQALPGRKKLKPLPAEYGQYVTVVAPLQAPDVLQTYLQSCKKGAGVACRQVDTWGQLRVNAHVQSRTVFVSAKHDDNKLQKLAREPLEFAKEVHKVGRPKSHAISSASEQCWATGELQWTSQSSELTS